MTQADKLIIKFTTLLKHHNSVTAAWLTGSYGRGDADQFSDVDIIAYVEDAAKAEETFTSLIDCIKKDGEIVFSKLILKSRTINTINEDWGRCDITIVDKSNLSEVIATNVKTLFDKNNATDLLPSKNLVSNYNILYELRENTEEFIRILGLLPVVISRQELAVAQSGVFVLKDKLIRLMLLENKGHVKRGALSIKKSLSAEQYALLEHMPVVSVSEDSIIKGHEYLAHYYLSKAKVLCSDYGIEWPSRFEEATLLNIKDKIGLDLTKQY